MDGDGGRAGRRCARCGAGLGAGDRACARCGAATSGLRAEAPRGLRVAVGVVVALIALVGTALATVALTDEGDGATAAPASSTTSSSTSTTTTTSAPAPTAPPSTVPPRSAGFADVYREVADGIVRIDVVGCEGGAVGTGFLVAPDLVVTAAHVVDGAEVIDLSTSEQVASGEVVGIDVSKDLALVRSDTRFRGHPFTFRSEAPEVGMPVALIGFPLGAPLSLATGAVSGLDRSVPDERGERIDGLVQTDVAANPGNSGGPLLDEAGEVVGVLSLGFPDAAGLAFAVGADVADPAVGRWRRQPDPLAGGATGCDPVGDGGASLAPVVVDVDHPDADGIFRAFEDYVVGINEADYERAYARLGGALRERIDYEAFVDGNETSVIVDLVVSSITDEGATTDLAEVSFTSYQAPEDGFDGQSCSLWGRTYVMELVDERWTLTDSTGGDPASCDG